MVPHAFRHLRLGGESCTAPEKTVLALIDAVAGLPDNGPRVAVSMLADVIDARKGAPSNALAGYCREYLRRHSIETLPDNHHDYQVGKIVKIGLRYDGGLRWHNLWPLN